MKILLAVFALVAVFHTGASLAQQQIEYVHLMKEKLQEERVLDQLASLCPEKRDDFEEVLAQVRSCYDKIDENKETLCSLVKNHFIGCTKPLVNLVDSCLPEESKGIPQMLFQSIANTANYLCKSDGEHIFELANSCFHKRNFRSRMCQRRLQSKFEQFQEQPPSKKQICDLLQSMKGCFHSHLQDSCGNVITRESFMGFYNAATSVCSPGDTTPRIDTNNIIEVEIVKR